MTGSDMDLLGEFVRDQSQDDAGRRPRLRNWCGGTLTSLFCGAAQVHRMNFVGMTKALRMALCFQSAHLLAAVALGL
jgi:hypothetical protein